MDAPHRVLIIQADTAATAKASALLTGAGYQVASVATGKEGLIESWRSRPDLIVVNPALADLAGLELVQKLRADPRTAPTKIVLLSSKTELKDMLEGKRAGANEYVALRPGSEADLLQRVRTLLPLGAAEPEAVPPSAAAQPAGRIVSFLSAKGGVGTSSLMANVAYSLQQQAAGKRVVAVDMVLPLGSISQIVGVTSPATVVQATQVAPAQITPEVVRKMTAPVPGWGFHLLSGPADPADAGELQLDRLETLFTSLRHAYDYVLVDLGRALSRVSLPVIYHSAAVMLVVSPDIATVALTKITLQYLESQGVRRSRVFPILNRAVGLEGMSRAELETQLGLKIVGMVPHLNINFTLANNQHVPLPVHRRDDTTTALIFQDLAAQLTAHVED